MLQLPEDDVRRQAWFGADRTATALVPMWPSREQGCQALSVPELFVTARCSMLGVEIPALLPIAGQPIPCSRGRRQCDPYGVQLGLACLPGDGWRRDWHDPALRVIRGHAERAGVPVLQEPRSLFAAVLDHDTLGRQRLAIVPDLVPTMHEAGPGGVRGQVRQLLFDVKTLEAGGADYVAASRQRERAGAVERRARRIPTEYLAAARRVDREMAVRRVTAAGQDPAVVLPPAQQAPAGPVELLLATFPDCRGLILGAYGEASPEVEALEDSFGAAIAAREWRQMGTRSEAEARGIVRSQLRRELSVATHAGHARMLLGRRAYVGLSRDAARALADRQAGDHDGVAVYIPPAAEARRRRARRAAGGRA